MDYWSAHPTTLVLLQNTMSPTMNMSQFTFGVDYRMVRCKPTGKVSLPRIPRVSLEVLCVLTPQTSIMLKPTPWSIDRFNARKGNQLVDARISLTTATHSSEETQARLLVIDREKTHASRLINQAIAGSWIGYANAMGLVYREKNSHETRKIITMRDLRLAFQDMNDEKCIAAVYFLTGFTRDVLHPQVLYGSTHQVAVEDYVMDTLNATFETKRSEMKPGHKTCVSQLYSQLYNSKHQKLKKQLLPQNVSVAVEGNGYVTPSHWKRPKTHYFVHKKTQLPSGTLLSETNLVR